MQTFLPYESYDDSAESLDYRRLGKQRVETLQILMTLLGVKVGNTTLEEKNGQYRHAYFDPDGYEVNPDDMNPGDINLHLYTQDLVPIMKTIAVPESQWTLEKHHPTMSRINHPVVQMWRGYEFALLKYQEAICDVWTTQFGYHDTCLAKTRYLFNVLEPVKPSKIKFPPWLGNEQFHISHQSNLIRKDPEHYEMQFPGVPDNIPYYYPQGKNG